MNELHIKWIHPKAKHHTKQIYFGMMHQSLFPWGFIDNYIWSKVSYYLEKNEYMNVNKEEKEGNTWIWWILEKKFYTPKFRVLQISFRVPQPVKGAKTKRARNVVEKKTKKKNKSSQERGTRCCMY
jgi:hypothetical protein